MTLPRPLPDEVAAAVVTGWRALAQPSRLQLVELLDRQGPQTVQVLADMIGVNQQNVSKHLAVLRAAGFLARHREGRLMWYAVAGPDVYACTEQIAAMVLRHLATR